MNPCVVSVEATDDYKLILSYDNLEKRIFDTAPILNFGRFSELKNVHEFKKVRVSFDSIEWANELDLDPEYLYKKSKPIESKTKANPENINKRIPTRESKNGCF